MVIYSNMNMNLLTYKYALGMQNSVIYSVVHIMHRWCTDEHIKSYSNLQIALQKYAVKTSFQWICCKCWTWLKMISKKYM